MNALSNIVDCSVWSGNWPFIHLRHRTPSALKEALAARGVVQAYLSPTEAILEQDPARANRQLFQSLPDGAFFSPVPVIDLSFANWQETAEEAASDPRVAALKLLPNYHMYELDEDTIAPLVELCRKHKLVISVQVRVEDARGRYPLMQVPDLDMSRVAKTVSAYPQQPFLLNNCYLRELDTVMPWLGNVYADTASIEVQSVFTVLRERYGLDRFVFATHSPFYFPEGNLYKLAYAEMDERELEAITRGNASTLFASTR